MLMCSGNVEVGVWHWQSSSGFAWDKGLAAVNVAGCGEKLEDSGLDLFLCSLKVLGKKLPTTTWKINKKHINKYDINYSSNIKCRI